MYFFQGTVEQNARAGRTNIYIQTKGTIKANNIIKQGLIDVVKSDWLISCDKQFTGKGYILYSFVCLMLQRRHQGEEGSYNGQLPTQNCN